MLEISQQRQYYTDKWSTFQRANTLELQRMARVLDYLSKVPSRDRICDLGCGAGWTTAVLGHFGRTLGVELSDVRRQQERYGHCEFVSANVLNWDHPRELFDVVVSLEVLEHIPHASQSRYLNIARDVLKPGGHLILTTPNKRTMLAMGDRTREWTNQPIEDWVTMSELAALLEASGFKVLRRSSVILGAGDRGTYRIVNSPRLASLVDSQRLLEYWQKLAAALNYGLHLTVLARKR